jgi:hypothetical protein
VAVGIFDLFFPATKHRTDQGLRSISQMLFGCWGTFVRSHSLVLEPLGSDIPLLDAISLFFLFDCLKNTGFSTSHSMIIIKIPQLEPPLCRFTKGLEQHS